MLLPRFGMYEERIPQAVTRAQAQLVRLVGVRRKQTEGPEQLLGAHGIQGMESGVLRPQGIQGLPSE
jgi:hypothetical protein